MDIERDKDGQFSANNAAAIVHDALALSYSPSEGMQKNSGGKVASTPLETTDFHDTSAEAETTPSKYSNWLIDGICGLAHLLFQAENVSAAIISCYWTIGMSYRESCMLRFHSPRGVTRCLIAYERLRT